MAYADLITKIWWKEETPKVCADFKDSQRHDSHELLTILLDGIHEDLNQVVGWKFSEDSMYTGEDDERDAMEACWEVHLQHEDSFIVSFFRYVCTCRSLSYCNNLINHICSYIDVYWSSVEC
jgi:ubiquitin C-terminal hydrolase